MSNFLNQLLTHTSVITSSSSTTFSMQSSSKSVHFKYSQRAWCQSNTADYCPLVIGLMSLIIIFSFCLIIYLCARSAFKCNILGKLFKRSEGSSRAENRARLNRTSSIISTLSTVNRTLPISNPTSVQTSIQNVWSTDISKYPRPPPTYEESQQAKPSKISRVIRTYPKKMPIIPISQVANVNDAFSMENLNESTISTNSVNNSSPLFIDGIRQSNSVFPSYRCLSLTTSPSTRATLQRLSAISRQLLEENGINEQIITTDLFSSNIDEVPPSYDTVIGSNQFNRSSSTRRTTQSTFYV